MSWNELWRRAKQASSSAQDALVKTGKRVLNEAEYIRDQIGSRRLPYTPSASASQSASQNTRNPSRSNRSTTSGNRRTAFGIDQANSQSVRNRSQERIAKERALRIQEARRQRLLANRPSVSFDPRKNKFGILSGALTGVISAQDNLKNNDYMGAAWDVLSSVGKGYAGDIAFQYLGKRVLPAAAIRLGLGGLGAGAAAGGAGVAGGVLLNPWVAIPTALIGTGVVAHHLLNTPTTKESKQNWTASSLPMFPGINTDIQDGVPVWMRQAAGLPQKQPAPSKSRNPTGAPPAPELPPADFNPGSQASLPSPITLEESIAAPQPPEVSRPMVRPIDIPRAQEAVVASQTYQQNKPNSITITNDMSNIAFSPQAPTSILSSKTGELEPFSLANYYKTQNVVGKVKIEDIIKQLGFTDTNRPDLMEWAKANPGLALQLLNKIREESNGKTLNTSEPQQQEQKEKQLDLQRLFNPAIASSYSEDLYNPYAFSYV